MVDKQKLRKILNHRCSLAEINTIFFDLDISSDEFPGGLNTKIEALIKYLEDREQLTRLIKWLEQNRLDIDLSSVWLNSSTSNDNFVFGPLPVTGSTTFDQDKVVDKSQKSNTIGVGWHTWVATIAAIIAIFGFLGYPQLSNFLNEEQATETPFITPTINHPTSQIIVVPVASISTSTLQPTSGPINQLGLAPTNLPTEIPAKEIVATRSLCNFDVFADLTPQGNKGDEFSIRWTSPPETASSANLIVKSEDRIPEPFLIDGRDIDSTDLHTNRLHRFPKMHFLTYFKNPENFKITFELFDTNGSIICVETNTFTWSGEQ